MSLMVRTDEPDTQSSLLNVQPPRESEICAKIACKWCRAHVQKKNLKSFHFNLYCRLCAYMCTDMHTALRAILNRAGMCMSAVQKATGSPWNWRYTQLLASRCGCWGLNSGPLEEQNSFSCLLLVAWFRFLRQYLFV